MAHVATTSPFIVLLILLTLFLGNGASSAAAAFSRGVRVKVEENVTHLHFYFHDVVSGPNATAVPVVPAAAPATPGSFGTVVMMDDLLTEGPEPTSRAVGRAQGFYAFAAMQELGFLQAMNLVFTDGPYNGSVVTVLGRNTPMRETREMPVVGGSGVFRFARGYAVARTHSIDAVTAVVEYNVYVMHYATPLYI